MILALVLWVFVGAYFGRGYAKARYWETIGLYADLGKPADFAIRREATIDACLELLKWIALGFMSAVAVLAHLLLQVALQKEHELRDPSFLGAFGFSALIFVLQSLSLSKPKRPLK